MENDPSFFGLMCLVLVICVGAALPIIIIAAAVSKPRESSRSGGGFVE